MSYVTLVLFSTILAAGAGVHVSEVIGVRASTAALLILGEVGIFRLGCYLLSVGGPPVLDIVAYSSYKFVGVLVVLGVRYVCCVVVYAGIGFSARRLAV
jgi:hypothetical protein